MKLTRHEIMEIIDDAIESASSFHEMINSSASLIALDELRALKNDIIQKKLNHE